MNALTNIQLEAQVIVEQLADRQINEMKQRYNEYQTWVKVDGNAVMDNYSDKIDIYQSTHKYIYMTQYRKWNHDLNKYELPIAYPSNYMSRYEMNKHKHLMFQVTELREQTRANWDVRYREDFIASNMFKLNRALAKHLTNEMTASNINVNIGGDGAEVTAIVDNMSFRTFGTLCGGDVQCLHYRYRSSLK